MIARTARGCAGPSGAGGVLGRGRVAATDSVIEVMYPDNPASRGRNRHCREGYWQGLPHPRRRRTLDGMAGTDDARQGGSTNDLRDFLTARRARVTPQQAGLPMYGGANRRVAGLRREEVALLSGISVEYL